MSKPALMRKHIGFILLTPTRVGEAKKGGYRTVWNPDWDGFLHTDINAALEELDEAQTALGDVCWSSASSWLNVPLSERQVSSHEAAIAQATDLLLPEV